MKQVLKTVYELKDIEKKAIDANRYINVDYDWYDFIFDDWKTKLHGNGFENAEIYFSGFCSQGDGACFDAKLNLETLAKKLNFQNLNLDDIEGELITVEHHYSHQNTRKISLYNYGPVENDSLISDFEKAIEELRYKLSCDLYNDLYEEYYYLISDEAVKETLIANDYLFESNGEIYGG